eukprot:10288585-Ditylum_brightwellii.AAC.1
MPSVPLMSLGPCGRSKTKNTTSSSPHRQGDELSQQTSKTMTYGFSSENSSLSSWIRSRAISSSSSSSKKDNAHLLLMNDYIENYDSFEQGVVPHEILLDPYERDDASLTIDAASRKSFPSVSSISGVSGGTRNSLQYLGEVNVSNKKSQDSSNENQQERIHVNGCPPGPKHSGNKVHGTTSKSKSHLISQNKSSLSACRTMKSDKSAESKSHLLFQNNSSLSARCTMKKTDKSSLAGSSTGKNSLYDELFSIWSDTTKASGNTSRNRSGSSITPRSEGSASLQSRQQGRNDEHTVYSNDRTEFSNDRTEFSNDRTEFSNDRTEFSNDRTEFSNDRTEFSNGRTEYSSE